jgi:hypothetical protein
MLPYLALIAGAWRGLVGQLVLRPARPERMAFGDYLMQPLTWFSSPLPAEVQKEKAVSGRPFLALFSGKKYCCTSLLLSGGNRLRLAKMNKLQGDRR